MSTIVLSKFQKYNPIGVASKTILLLTGDTAPKDLRAMVIISIRIAILYIFTVI